ncbi:MAG: peroxiredoxin-like family protein [Pseudolabrys sp.]|nr:peroxiredoxin-like family protein [Pseudolabrys sp.]
MSDQGNLPRTPAEVLALASSLPGGLGQKLTAYLGHSRRLRPEMVAAIDRLIFHLNALYGEQIGPAVGDEMPAFLLPNQMGELVSLDGFLESGPLVISINRGHWCPYCKLDLRALAEIEPEIRGFGAQLVSIMPERAQFTKQAIADNRFPFPILSDVDLSYTLSLGLIYWVGAEVKELYKSIGLDLEKFQGNRNYFLPMAAKFIVGRDGIVKARVVDVDFRLRMEPKAILEALARL